MSNSSGSLPANTSIIIPRLVCRDPASEIEFCVQTFDAVEPIRHALQHRRDQRPAYQRQLGRPWHAPRQPPLCLRPLIKEIASHAVLVPDGIRFFAGTTQRDWTDELLASIRGFYGPYGEAGGCRSLRPETTGMPAPSPRTASRRAIARAGSCSCRDEPAASK